MFVFISAQHKLIIIIIFMLSIHAFIIFETYQQMPERPNFNINNYFNKSKTTCYLLRTS
jgi:hypothetical protein